MSLGYKKNIIKQVFIHETMNWGGAEVLRKTYASYANKSDNLGVTFEILIICLRSKGVLGEVLDNMDGVQVIALNWQGKLPAWGLVWQLCRKLRAIKPDVVHTCLFEANRHGVIASRLAGIQKVMIEEHGDNCWMGWRERWLSRMLVRLSSQVLTVSQAHAKHIIDYMPYPRDKVTVLRNCVDIQRLLLSEKKEDEVSQGCFLLNIGSLRKIKNMPVLLQAHAMVLKRVPDCHLSIVGDGELKSELVELTHALDMSEQVSFLGLREDIGSLLNQADIYVHAGSAESFCIAMAEALCSSRACVAPDNAVFRELTHDGKVAMLVEPNSPEAMADAIVYLINHKAERKALGEAAGKYALENFLPEQYILSLLGIYKAIGVLRA